jgi:multiple sugar transport system substrate-binding protein
MRTPLTLGLAIMLAVVGIFVPPAQPSHAATTITFWERSSESAITQPLVDAYNASHATQVQLTLIPPGDFPTKFGAAAASGNVPDVAAVDLVLMPSFTTAHQMMDITSFAHSISFFSTLSKGHLRQATYKGKIYGVPYDAESSLLIYNKTLFQQAGLNPNKPPKTWAQIEADSKKITKLGNGVYGYYMAGNCGPCNAFEMIPHIWADHGNLLNSSGTKATVNTSAVKDFLTFYHRMWTEGQMPPGAATDNGANFVGAFLSGKIGMEDLGQFMIGVAKGMPSLKIGVTYIPGKTGGWASFDGGDDIGIPKGSKHVKEAETFIRWVLSTQTQLKLFARQGHIPVRTDLAAKGYAKEDARYAVANNALLKGRVPFSVHYNELFNDPNGPWAALVHDAVFSGNVNSAVTQAQRRFSSILSK